MLCCVVIDVEGDAGDDCKIGTAKMEDISSDGNLEEEDEAEFSMNRMESISSAMELAQPDQEELIYEGDDDEELQPMQGEELGEDDMDIDTGSEVIFDLAQEVDLQIDTTADNEQDASLTSSNSAVGGGVSAKGKTTTGEEGSRFVCHVCVFPGPVFVHFSSTGYHYVLLDHAC